MQHYGINSRALRRSATAAMLGAIVGLGLLLRCSFLRNFVKPEGGFWFYSIDAYDHLRWVTLGVASFPQVPLRDWYMGFPVGTDQIWPPLYDYLLSAAAVAAGGSRIAIETVCFFANPAYAAVTVVVLFAFTRRLLADVPAALVGALLLATAPAHISYSHPMNFDHHVFEPIAVLILMALVFLERDDRLTVAGKIATAAALTVTIFMWRGSIIYWGLTLLRVLAWSLLQRRPQLARDYAWGVAGAAAALGVFVVADPWGNAGAVSFETISSFHVIVLAIAAFVLAAIGSAAGSRRPPVALGLALAAVAGSLVLAPVREAASNLLTGLAFFSRSADPWIASNSELKGMFQDREFFSAASYLTVFWFLAPAALIHAAVRWWRVERGNRLLFAFCFVAPLIAMGLVRRYGHVAAVGSALAGAYLFALWWRACNHSLARAGAAACVIALLLPSLPHYRDTWQSRLPDPLRLGLLGPEGTLTWLRESTPKTSHYLDEEAPPEYGVMAEWDMGALLFQVAERPAVATEFGWETHGFYEENVFMATATPTTAALILRENRVRYVLLRALQDRSKHFANAQYGVAQGRVAADRVATFDPDRSIYARLMYNDGAAYRIGAAIVPGLGQYRLVFESDYLYSAEPGRELSYYKVFEFVPGASIEGSAAPSSEVVARLPLRSARGRRFDYTNWTKAAPDGRFTLSLPYATNSVQGTTVAGAAYTITDGSGGSATLEVSEAAVASGNPLAVALSAPVGR